MNRIKIMNQKQKKSENFNFIILLKKNFRISFLLDKYKERVFVYFTFIFRKKYLEIS
jgi:hypothetical protein